MAESLESVAIVKPVKPVKPLETLETLTSQAAEVIVAAQMVAKSNNEAVQRARIAAVPAIEEWEARVGGRTFYMREIEPPVIPLSPRVNQVFESEESKNAALASWLASESLRNHEFRHLSFSATVYDRAVSEIVWRDASGHPFKILSNVDFNYLSGIGRIHTKTVSSTPKIKTREPTIIHTHWTTFLFVSNIDSEKEQRMVNKAKELGIAYTPKKRPELAVFDSKQIEYIVLDDPDFPAPKALYEEMDFILEYYRDHEAALKVAFQRREALSAAYTAWEKANPPPAPKDVIVNFWKIR
jgi:hypothetical protein